MSNMHNAIVLHRVILDKIENFEDVSIDSFDYILEKTRGNTILSNGNDN